MSFLKRFNSSAIIPLQPSKQELEATPEFIKHTQYTKLPDGTQTSTEERIPRIGNTSTPRQIIQYLEQFDIAADHLGWTDNELLKQRFRVHLTGIQHTHTGQPL